MADIFYPKQSKTPVLALPEMLRFLVETGDWTLIHAYSSVGAGHEQPSDASDIDTLSANNAWRTSGTTTDIVVSDYFVVECNSSTFKFQVGFEYQTTDQYKVILAFKAGFNISTPANDMTTAGNWTLPVSATVTLDMNNSGVGDYYMVANSSRFIFAFHDGTASHTNLMYCGDIVTKYTGDGYPSVIYTLPTAVYTRYNAGYGSSVAFDKLSKVDDTTVIDLGGTVNYGGAGGYFDDAVANIIKDSDTGEQAFLPIEIASSTVGHYGNFGTLDGLYYTHRDAGTSTGVTPYDSLNYLVVGNQAGDGKLVFPHDGSTAV